MSNQTITTTPKHTKHTFSYAASMTFYKLSYYGWRSIVILFLFADINDESSLPEMDNFYIYLSIGFATSYLIGGILGDLLIGNKRAAYIGGSVMILGSLLSFIDLSMPPEIPVILFMIGCGLYQSNLRATYAKLYLHDTRLLDSGFMILYLFINLGSFLGTLLIGIAGYYGIEYGFLAVGISTLLSILMLAIVKEPTQTTINSIPEQKSFFNRINLRPILVVLGLYAIFGLFWKLTYYDVFANYWGISWSQGYVPYYWINMLSFAFYLIIGVYLVVLWSKKYYSHLAKLTISTILVLLVFGVSFLSYSEGSTITSVITIVGLFVYTIAELLVEPLVDSSIAKLVNRKFLAIAYGSLSFLFIGFGYVATYAENGLNLFLENTIYVGFGGLLVLSVILAIRFRNFKKTQRQ